MAAAVSANLSNYNSVSIGASGAVFGLLLVIWPYLISTQNSYSLVQEPRTMQPKS